MLCKSGSSLGQVSFLLIRVTVSQLVSRRSLAVFDLLPSACSHGLKLPISQRSPQPFYRAKLESPQPPHAQRNLDETDDNCEEQAKRGSDFAEEGEAVAIEDQGADE